MPTALSSATVCYQACGVDQVGQTPVLSICSDGGGLSTLPANAKCIPILVVVQSILLYMDAGGEREKVRERAGDFCFAQP